MTNRILNIALCSLILLISSCAYLDVNEKGVVSEDEMFKDVSGFYAAMYGVYSTMRDEKIYGRELTYGFIEEVCYQYNNIGNENFKKILSHDYLASEVRPTIDEIWYTSYRTISYINNVLKFTENGVLNKKDYTYIKGEALGLRAFIHFDLLRMFAKTYKFNDQRGVPYQTDYSQDVPPTGTIKKTCELILNDLIEAENLLKDNTEMFNPSDEELKSASPYYSEQTIHFNLYAVKATLARVYLYMGENKLAAEKALEVIESEKFPLMQKTELTTVSCFYPNRGEAIFGLHSTSVYEDLYNTFINNSGIGESIDKIRIIKKEDIERLYETATFTDTHTDYRFNSYFKDTERATLLRRYGEEVFDAKLDKAKVAQALTIIQIPEMYYIYAEAIYDEDPIQAIDCFNFIINSRGLRNIDELNPISSKEAFLNAIYADRRKEYFGTGMMFFEAKRQNKDLVDFDNQPVAASDEIYVLPWPELEKEYGTAH